MIRNFKFLIIAFGGLAFVILALPVFSQAALTLADRLLAIQSPPASAPTAMANYIQNGGNGTTTGSTNSVAAVMNDPQRVGDTNIVLVGWDNSTGSVSSITDTNGNSYSLVTGPVNRANASIEMYAAYNIKAANAGANTVTVNLSANETHIGVSVYEYSGVATSSTLDTSASATGSSTTSAPGSMTTTNANDLIFTGDYDEASTYDNGQSTGPAFASFFAYILGGGGFGFGNVANQWETSTGTFNPSFSLPTTSPWAMAAGAFKLSLTPAIVQMHQEGGNFAASGSSIEAYFQNYSVSGDAVIAVISWVDSGSTTISSVVDTNSNPYTLAVGPTRNATTHVAQAIYYAKNISAPSAVLGITATFSAGVSDLGIDVVEYSGLSTTSPLVATSGNSGSGTACNSGTLTTGGSNQLLVGAVSTSSLVNFTVGSSFRTIVNNFVWNDITPFIEDSFSGGVGNYNATATLGSSESWVMQAAAFAPSSCGVSLAHASYGGSATTVPSVTVTIPSTTAGNTLIVVMSYNVYDADLSSVTDNASGGSDSFSSASDLAAYVSSYSGSTSIWYAKNIKGGTTSVTVTFPANAQAGVTVYEVSGLSTTAPLDQKANTGTTVQGPTLTPSAPTVTPTSSCSFVVSAIQTDDSITSSNNSFTNHTDVNGNAQSYYIAPVNGTYGADWNASSSTHYCSSTADFH